jgi:hypothetical protein
MIKFILLIIKQLLIKEAVNMYTKENSQKRLMAKTIKFSSEEIETITSNAQKKNIFFTF